MFRYQILIEYVGTNFKGWQIQKKGKTIQGLIQKNISLLLKEKIVLFGSGRTDTGVHAIEQSAHFDCKNKIENKDDDFYFSKIQLGDFYLTKVIFETQKFKNNIYSSGKLYNEFEDKFFEAGI